MSESQTRSPDAELGLLDATMIGMGAMIGAGIFVLTGLAAEIAGPAAILVFALLISVLSIVQVSGVPALNEQVEFEHNARVQGDLRAFSSSVDSAAATGRDQPATVKTGVRYPPRLFLLNPGPTAGTLSTTGESEVRFGNLEALDPEAGQFLDSANAPAPYTTTVLTRIALAQSTGCTRLRRMIHFACRSPMVALPSVVPWFARTRPALETH